MIRYVSTNKTKTDKKSALAINDQQLEFICKRMKYMTHNFKYVKLNDDVQLHYRKKDNIVKVGFEYKNHGVSDDFYTEEDLRNLETLPF